MNHYFLACALLVGIGVHAETYYDLLQVEKDSTATMIKKAYRKLALSLHPDKQSTKSESDSEVAAAIFLEVQNAYSILGSPIRRLQYDLSLSGVDYEDYEEPEPESMYMNQGIFAMYMQTKIYKMAFETEFPETRIPVLKVAMNVNLKQSIIGLKSHTHSYFRKSACRTCGGTGSKGIPKKCEFCDGTGIASHLYSHSGGQYQQMTNCTCTLCSGRGFVPESKCDDCGGSGMKVEECTFEINLPPGFKSGHTLTINKSGHVTRKGTAGDVEVTANLVLPAGWTVDNKGILLYHSIKVPFANAFDNQVALIKTPSDEKIELDLSFPAADVKCSDLHPIIYGYDRDFPGLGIVDNSGTGSRGLLRVHINCDFSTVHINDIVNLLDGKEYLSVSDIKNSDNEMDNCGSQKRKNVDLLVNHIIDIPVAVPQNRKDRIEVINNIFGDDFVTEKEDDDDKIDEEAEKIRRSKEDDDTIDNKNFAASGKLFGLSDIDFAVGIDGIKMK